MKEIFFNDTPAIQAACKKQLKTIPVVKYSKDFESLYDRSMQFISRGGVFIKG